MEIENYTKEPTLEEYGLDANSYENYRNQKDKLEKLRVDLVNKFSSNGYLIMFVSLLVGLIFQSGIIAIIGVIFGGIFAFFENTKEKEIIKKRQDVDSKIELIKNKVYPFEQACEKFYLNYLEHFFQNNLYKKRSGSEKFDQSLSEFSLMINEVGEISKKLIFTDIWLKLLSHRSYLNSRQIDHKYQINKKFSSFNSVKTKTDEKPEQKSETIKNLIPDNYKKEEELIEKQDKEIGISNWLMGDDYNYNSKKDSDKKIEMVVSKNLLVLGKEKIQLMPPEKKFRTARKIDNWEEINKKRKETGNKGEEIVFLLEQEYFISINRKDLADKVRHVSKEDGDGLGYDILSFFDDGKEKYIEVKSTTASIESPFNISKNELEFLEDHYDDAFIYRVSVSNEIPEVKVRPSFEILESEIIPISYIVKNK